MKAQIMTAYGRTEAKTLLRRAKRNGWEILAIGEKCSYVDVQVPTDEARRKAGAK